MLSDTQRAALAARLRQGRRTGPAPAGTGPVIDLGTAGTVPAYLLHAVGGSVFEYAALVRELAGRYRLYGIEAGGLRADTRPAGSLAEMADRYAQAIRTCQPTGPYRLIGWSMGGVLAFETARRIEDSGGTVGLVVLIDTPYRTVASYADSAEGLAALFVADALRASGGTPGPGTAPVAEQLDGLAARLAPDADGRAELRAELERRYAVFVAHTDALASYQPTAPVSADAVLVSAADSPDSAPDWSRMFRGRVRAVPTAAHHYACLRPPAVTDIAELIGTAEEAS